MFRTLMTATVALLIALPTQAQDDRLDEITFDEVALKEEQSPYFAVGVGPAVNFMFPSLDDINDHATGFGLGEFKAPVVISGADIFTAIGIIDNVRAGFFWIGGGSETTKQFTVSNVNVERTMTYSIFLRGVYFDYAFVPVKGLAILPGVGLGWGSQEIELYQAPTSRTWDDFDGPNDIVTSPDAYSLLERNFLHVSPHLNIEYAFTPYLNIRAAAAYNLQVSSGDWMGTKTSTVSGVPDGISINSFSAQIGLFVGLFN